MANNAPQNGDQRRRSRGRCRGQLLVNIHRYTSGTCSSVLWPADRAYSRGGCATNALNRRAEEVPLGPASRQARTTGYSRRKLRRPEECDFVIMTAMRAIRIRENGGVEKLRLDEVPVPEPKAGEVRVRGWRAAGINFVDTYQRSGLLYPRPPALHALGLEVAGTVSAIGARRQRIQAGETGSPARGRTGVTRRRRSCRQPNWFTFPKRSAPSRPRRCSCRA